MREVIQKIIETEAEAQHLIDQARQEAEALTRQAREEARALTDRALQLARAEADRLVAEAQCEAGNRLRFERERIARDLETGVRMEPEEHRRGVQTVVEAVLGVASPSG